MLSIQANLPIDLLSYMAELEPLHPLNGLRDLNVRQVKYECRSETGARPEAL